MSTCSRTTTIGTECGERAELRAMLEAQPSKPRPSWCRLPASTPAHSSLATGGLFDNLPQPWTAKIPRDASREGVDDLQLFGQRPAREVKDCQAGHDQRPRAGCPPLVACIDQDIGVKSDHASSSRDGSASAIVKSARLEAPLGGAAGPMRGPRAVDRQSSG